MYKNDDKRYTLSYCSLIITLYILLTTEYDLTFIHSDKRSEEINGMNFEILRCFLPQE